MFKILHKSFEVGTATAGYPSIAPRLAEQFRGCPEFDFKTWSDARPAAEACPTLDREVGEHARVAALRVPVLDFTADLGGWVHQMRRLNAPAIFNLENWGLGGVELPERQG